MSVSQANEKYKQSSALSFPAVANGNIVRIVDTGMSIAETEEALPGVTLEGIGTARTVIAAMRRKSERGIVNLADYPLLKVLDVGAEQGDIPWSDFTFGD